ncbi:uncharacterized protein MKK02DRAFT_38736 [Dioszegia hungarica]|uniref:Uncharacterized protein n=1 Tax=Dioszegia hungarica TaxID=4972 RepID=A0AA38LSG8_9TREE|nr:uncharacterized protein MKK02DRAFT_38736 [Dioszegia hungarica]KAI9634065.1 hypothetical protein MKK02DRAFT_38736 [Dioszegia hungarica]
MSGKPPDNLPSEVSILKTKAAAKKGLNVTPEKTEVVWPKPEFGPGTKIQFVTDEGQEAKGFVVAAGSMFPLGAAIPAKHTLQHGLYLPPGSMLPGGALVPIHQRMVSVQPIETKKSLPGPAEPVCSIQ